jgi:photosystem II stability/assembly factor-like uncharacterized protein
MSLKSHIIAVSASLALLGISSVHVTAQEAAPIVPLASKSVLLDITSAGERLVVAGEHGHILYSDDNGGRWTQATVPTTQMLTGIDFADAQHGWVVGHDGLILATDDSGENWHIQRDGLEVQNKANLAQRRKIDAQIKRLTKKLEIADEEAIANLESELEEAELELEDAEITLSEELFTSPLMDVWFRDTQTGWAVGAFGTFLQSKNGGQSWQSKEIVLDNPEAYHLNTIVGDNSGRIFIAGEGGAMYRSMDGGQTWEKLRGFYAGSWFGAVYSAGHDALLLFGLQGNLYRSTDFGTSWGKINTDNNITLSGGNASPRGGIALVGAEGTVLLSDNGGQSFKQTETEDRLSLSSGIIQAEKIIVVGQGGIKIVEGVANYE